MNLIYFCREYYSGLQIGERRLHQFHLFPSLSLSPSFSPSSLDRCCFCYFTLVASEQFNNFSVCYHAIYINCSCIRVCTHVDVRSQKTPLTFTNDKYWHSSRQCCCFFLVLSVHFYIDKCFFFLLLRIRLTDYVGKNTLGLSTAHRFQTNYMETRIKIFVKKKKNNHTRFGTEQ